MRVSAVRLSVLAAGVAAAPMTAAAPASDPSWFPDRPVAWQEHDDQPLAKLPESTHLEELSRALLLRDSIAGEVDRVLALEGRLPAEDVNALDEVPCSTWFCARNHLRPMKPAAVSAGPAGQPPALPLRITKGKDRGATAGFQVQDANGRKFMLKFDPTGHIGLATGSEMVGELIFHAAGYNVPGPFLLDLAPGDLGLDPKATFRLDGVAPRPLTESHVRAQLVGTAHLPDGRIRAVATAWIPGHILGGFDTIGRREDDPNDRIPHEHRRSVRAAWVLFAWLSELDPGSINSLDTVVQEGGHQFVRHYVIDFGATLGSETLRPKSLQRAGEYIVEVGRTLGAFFSLGLYHRPFQGERDSWETSVRQYPSAGWFPAEDFDPDAFRSNRKIPAHMRKTDRDLYWGAKLVTSFSDAQIAAVLAKAGFPPADTAYLDRALRVRRDIIGRRYLRAIAAVENPEPRRGMDVCFDDLAIARGYAEPREVRYQVEVSDGHGRQILREQVAPDSSNTCVPIGGPGPGTGYRVVSVTTEFGGAARHANVSKASRVHLRWRESERRFVVVGLERDE